MHSNYIDITSRISDPILWWDEGGCPRYDVFHPEYCPSIYANDVVLMEIECQYCHKSFKVELHTNYFDSRSRLEPKKWHYGDPPVHGCVGDTMNCDDIAILEVWQRNKNKDEGYLNWTRRHDLEGPIDGISST